MSVRVFCVQFRKPITTACRMAQQVKNLPGMQRHYKKTHMDSIPEIGKDPLENGNRSSIRA